MSVQSNNLNIQNKFIKIDGEYVKLYVTTNKTLPKLLKNTGSLIVYHDAVLNVEKNDTPLNYLYLANNLIASGWGFHKENQRDYAEYFFNYGKDYSGDHISENSEQYSHNYYNVVNKLYDVLSFWDGIESGQSDKKYKDYANNQIPLVDKDVIREYELYFEDDKKYNDVEITNTEYSPDRYKDLVNFYSLYKNANVFSVINDISSRICYNSKIQRDKFVLYNSNLTNVNIDKYAPYAMQYLSWKNIRKVCETAPEYNTYKLHVDKNLTHGYRVLPRKIFLDMIPYMLGPAIYNKPEVIEFDADVYYRYITRNTINNENTKNNFGYLKAKKVNGKYQVPKGATIYKVDMHFVMKMNDARSLTALSFKYGYTQYNNHLTSTVTSDNSNELHKFIGKSFIFNYDDSDYNNVGVMNENFKSFSTIYSNRQTVQLIKTQTQYNDNYVHYTCTFENNSDLSIVFEDFKLIQDLAFTIEGITKLKHYTGFSNSLFDDPMMTETDPKTNERIGADALYCMTDVKQGNSYKDSTNRYKDILYSFEYAWDTTTLELPIEINIEATDVVFVNTIPINGRYDNEKYYINKGVTNDALTFNVSNVFSSYRYISQIQNNYTVNLLNKPIITPTLKAGYTIEQLEAYKEGFDMILIGVPKNKMIKNVWANIEHDVSTGTKQTKKLQKENITGLLKVISNINYFISLNPEICKFRGQNNTVAYKYAAVTDLDTNVFAQPYRIYFCLLPRTYMKNNNGIISLEIEFDEELVYTETSNTFSKYVWSKSTNVGSNKSINKDIKMNNPNSNSSDKIIDVISMIAKNTIDIITNTNYDSTHIFDLSYNVDVPLIKYEVKTDLSKLNNKSFNAIMMLANKEQKNKIVNYYLEKLNEISL